MKRNNPPPHLIFEREYWLDPVQVFTGLTWAVIGFFVGVVVCKLL